MAFNRQNNQNDNKNDVNTRGYQFFNMDGIEPSTMSIGGWNEMLSIRINPALEPSKRSEGRFYDYDRSVSTSLNGENVAIILKKIKEKIIPAIDKGEEASVGVAMNGGSSLLVVSSGVRLTGSVRPFLAIHKNLNPDTKKPEMSMFYEFKTGQSIDNYDETTGKYTLDNTNTGEFYLFTKILESYMMAVGKTITHFNRVVNRALNDKIVNSLNAISDKVGAETNFAPNTGFRNNSRRNIFGNSSTTSNTNDEDDATMETLGDISDLASMLDQ